MSRDALDRPERDESVEKRARVDASGGATLTENHAGSTRADAFGRGRDDRSGASSMLVDSDASGSECSMERVMETLFARATARREHARTRREVNGWTLEAIEEAATAFGRRASAEARAADNDGIISSGEVLSSVVAASRIFDVTLRNEFERRAVDAIERGVLERAVARGFRLVVRDARMGTRTTPADADALAENASLAYSLTQRLKHSNDQGGDESARALRQMWLAVFEFLSLDSPPSRDAALTAGVTLASAYKNEHPEGTIEALERIFFSGDACTSIDAARMALWPTSMITNSDASNVTLSAFGSLAMIRGFVIVVSPQALSKHGDGDFMLRNLLPGICSLIESASDAHYRYHAVTCLRTALEKLASAGLEGDRLPRESFDRVALTIATLWEDNLGQTVREVQTVFGLLLDIVAGSTNCFDYVEQVVEQTLRRPAEQKSKYLALRVLVSKVGASKLLAIEPNLLPVTLAAMTQHSISTAASSALSDLSASYLEELKSVDEWRSWWLGSVRTMLLNNNSNDRVAMATYILPTLFKQDGASVIELTKSLVKETNANRGEACASAAVVAVLKVARSLQLVDPERITVLRVAGDRREYEIDQGIIDRAMMSVDRAARLDVLEWLCLEGRKSCTLPSEYERTLLKRMISANLKGCAIYFDETRRKLNKAP